MFVKINNLNVAYQISVVRKAKQDLQDLQDEQDEESKVDIDVVSIYYDSACLSKLTISTLHIRFLLFARRSRICKICKMNRMKSQK